MRDVGLPAAVIAHDRPTHERAEQHQRVGHDEHDISENCAVSDKPRLRGHLPDEQPSRNAFAGAFFPLTDDLADDRRQQDHRSRPSEHVFHEGGF